MLNVRVKPRMYGTNKPPQNYLDLLFAHTHTHTPVCDECKDWTKAPCRCCLDYFTCCRSMNGGSTFSVCRSCNCNKPLFSLECYQKKKKKIVCWPLSSQKTSLFWPFNYLGANWTWVFMMFEEFRALSLYKVCHLCLLRSHVAIRAFLWFKLWLMNICASRWSSCEVMLCNYLCLYYSYISIFDTWPTECICIATRGKGRGSPLLYAKRSCTVHGIVLN